MKQLSIIINFSIVALILIAIYIFEAIVEKEKQSILISSRNTATKVQGIVDRGINSIHYLHATALDIYQKREYLGADLVYKIKEINDNGEYALNDPNHINLTGYDGLKVDKEIVSEMAMALYMQKYFKVIADFNKDYAWVYYISKNKFATFYPYLHSDRYTHTKKNANYEIYTKGLPKNNPEGKIYFTQIYIDAIGLGLMTTIGKPVYDNKEFLGTVDIDITLASYIKILNDMNMFDGSSIIANNENQVIASSGIDGFSTKKVFQLDDFIQSNLLKEIKDNELIYFDFNYMYVKQLKDIPWKLYYKISIFDVYSKAFFSSLAIFIIIILLLQVKGMIRRIGEVQVELSELNSTLEQRVKCEVDKNREKEVQLLKQSKLAQMGELISMIAHQWKQPLNAISAISANIRLKLALNYFDFTTKKGIEDMQKEIDENLSRADDCIKNLVTTMDDFRNFHNPNKLSIEISFSDVIEKALKIVKASLEMDNIALSYEYKSYEKITMYDNEIIQVILNILKNAQDNFNEKDIKQRKITISTDERQLKICDNGGGIKEDIIENIFDIYFSTKNEKSGTGLGLYLSKTIVEEHHKGMFSAANIDDGVCFCIDLKVE